MGYVNTGRSMESSLARKLATSPGKLFEGDDNAMYGKMFADATEPWSPLELPGSHRYIEPKERTEK